MDVTRDKLCAYLPIGSSLAAGLVGQDLDLAGRAARRVGRAIGVFGAVERGPVPAAF